MTRGPVCTLTRAITVYARHRFREGGPTDDHGHLYRIEVTVRGRLRRGCSSVIDLALFDQVIDEQLSTPLHGRDLNTIVPAFASGEQQPTCEAFAGWCWQQIAPRLPSEVSLASVRVAEDSELWAECTGAEPVEGID